MPELLAEVTRGPIVESRHYGHIAVCDSDGRLIAYAGEPKTVTYFRSAAKPIQALNVFLSGAYDRFRFTDQELAIICSSHYGETMHAEVILRILKKLDLPIEALLCGSPLSVQAGLRNRQLWEHHDLKPYNSDCSGKHCGFLASCLAKGYPIEEYDHPDHPLQRDILRIVSDVTGVPANDIAIGVDGCGVPVHGIPVQNMAMAYARITNPEHLPAKYRFGAETIFTAMNTAPEMVAGTGGFCTELIKNAHGRLIGKLGAEAVYCVGIKDRNIGIAVKIEDGQYHRPLYPTVISVLRQLDLLTRDETEALKAFAAPPVINDLGREVGVTRSAFRLKTV